MICFFCNRFKPILKDCKIDFCNIRLIDTKIVSFESPWQGDSKAIIIFLAALEMHWQSEEERNSKF